MTERIKALFLNEDGIKALDHLANYMRDRGVMDCSQISVEGPYVEARVKLQGEVGEKLGIEAHLLIPHQFVKLVVLDEIKNRIGFQ